MGPPTPLPGAEKRALSPWSLRFFEPPSWPADKFQLISITELSKLQKANLVHVFDANDEKTRAKYGVIPGAVLLSSYRQFDVAKVLPATKTDKVVFYCANIECMASHAAAERAVGAGYTNVAVLPDGIMGWKKAGEPTQSMPRS